LINKNYNYESENKKVMMAISFVGLLIMGVISTASAKFWG